MSNPVKSPGPIRPLPNLIFASRWLQLPLYLGLIAAQAIYVFHFWVELVHLIEAAFGNQDALQAIFQATGQQAAQAPKHLTETTIMLVVLGLIDVVMISNLLVMVIVGGYETFVSRLGLEGHRDQPEWLSHVNASVLKVKLAMAIIGISSIHLLKTFIEAGALGGLPGCATVEAGVACARVTETGVMWQTIIHLAFIVSAIGIAYTDRLMNSIDSKAGAQGGH